MQAKTRKTDYTNIQVEVHSFNKDDYKDRDDNLDPNIAIQK